jgi:hypothetical protein
MKSSRAFDESITFQLTDWLDHVPKEVLAKNFQTDISAFEYIPGAELFIFPGRKLFPPHVIWPVVHMSNFSF